MSAADGDRAAHWENVYARGDPATLSWHRAHLDASLALLEQAGLSPQSRVLDVGGGASTLADDLLARGVTALSVLDLSPAALAAARARLGERAAMVGWLAGDITRIPLSAAGYTHWHDRAVLHFLDDDAARAYAMQAQRAVAAGGFAVIGGFAPEGPQRCSGLSVVRRSAAQIAALLGDAFVPVDERAEVHRTPSGREQAFVYALLRRR